MNNPSTPDNELNNEFDREDAQPDEGSALKNRSRSEKLIPKHHEQEVEAEAYPTPHPVPGDGHDRSILVISYYFPPMGLSGVLRISTFLKYLARNGWSATVLTVGDVGYYVYDHTLLAELESAGVDVVRTKTRDPLSVMSKRKRKTVELKQPSDRVRRFARGVTHTFLQPDNKIGWRKHAVAAGRKLIDSKRFDVILSTGPPFTDFLIGLDLHKQSGLPLVVDYRDPWLENGHYFYATPLHRRYAAKLEEEVLKNSEGVVVVNRRIKEMLIARWPFLTHESVHIIPSGYDPERLAEANPDRVRGRKLRFLYSGLFDAKRSPESFFKGLAKVFARRPEARDEIEAVFVGTFREQHKRMAAKIGVASAIVTPGYLEHREMLDWLLSADVLWLTIYDTAITPGKMYEYMGTRKPILALAPEGVVRRILDDYGAAIYADPDDVDAIAEAIEAFYEGWKSGNMPVGSEGTAEEYDAMLLVDRLARVLAHAMHL